MTKWISAVMALILMGFAYLSGPQDARATDTGVTAATGAPASDDDEGDMGGYGDEGEMGEDDGGSETDDGDDY